MNSAGRSCIVAEQQWLPELTEASAARLGNTLRLRALNEPDMRERCLEQQLVAAALLHCTDVVQDSKGEAQAPIAVLRRSQLARHLGSGRRHRPRHPSPDQGCCSGSVR